MTSDPWKAAFELGRQHGVSIGLHIAILYAKRMGALVLAEELEKERARVVQEEKPP